MKKLLFVVLLLLGCQRYTGIVNDVTTVNRSTLFGSYGLLLVKFNDGVVAYVDDMWKLSIKPGATVFAHYDEHGSQGHELFVDSVK